MSARCGNVLEAFNQTLFVISSQPSRPTAVHQSPHQVDACGDAGPSIDYIAAKHQMIPGWQDGNQAKQGLVTPVHVTDNPVMASSGRHFERFVHLILTV